MILRIAREKVGHRQGPISQTPHRIPGGAFAFGPSERPALADRSQPKRPKVQVARGLEKPDLERGRLFAFARSDVTMARMARLWERVRSRPLLKGAFLYCVVAAFALVLGLLPNPHEAP